MGQVQIYDRPPSQHLTTPPKPPLSSLTNGTLDSSTPLEEDNGRIQIHVKLVTPNSIFPVKIYDLHKIHVPTYF